MKAVVIRTFGPIGHAVYADVPDPVAGPGEVLVDVAAAEVNFPDILVMEGAYQARPPLPFSPGTVAAGTVAALGEGVTTLAVGDRVAVQVEYGAYAEKLRAMAECCFPMPDEMPFQVGAALGLVYQTAHFALAQRASFQPGEAVLVLGATGGVGSAGVQLARAMGAGMVIGGVFGPQSVEAAAALGCEHVVDLSREDIHDSLREAVHALTGGRGVDVVLDPVGGAANAAALRALAWCGRLVIIGFAAGEIPVIKTNYLLVKNIAVSGLQWSDYRARRPHQVRNVQEEIFASWRRGQADPFIGKVLPLSRFAEALADLRSRRTRGKIVLTTDRC